MTILQSINAAASPEVQMNENYETLSAAGIFGKRHPSTSGLTWGYYGGLYQGNTIADGTVTLTDAATNYVVVLRSTGVVSVSTSPTNSTDPLYAKLYQLTTASGVVTAALDQRMDSNGLLLGNPAVSASVELKGLTFTSDTGSTADSDPGNGKFKWNNATQASATVLFFDNQTADGVSLATFYASLGSSGYIYMQQGDDSTKWQLWKWTATPVDGTGYRKFTAAIQASSASAITTNKTVDCSFSSAQGVDVLGTPLTGLSTATGTSVLATDTVLQGVGKLQAQISGLVGGVGAASGLRAINFAKAATVVQAQFAPPALNLVTEAFVSDTGQFTHLGATPFTTFVVSGTLVATNSSGAARSDTVQVGADITMPQLAVSVDITARTNAATGYDFVTCGIAKDANNMIVATYERIANSITMQLIIGGTQTFNAAVTPTAMTAPFSMGFSLIGNVACVYTNTGSGWTFRTSYDFTAKLNLKAAALTGWKACFGYASNSNSSITLDNFTAGRFGGFGFRDFSVVTNENGTPYISSGLAYFTAAMNDGSGVGSQGLLSLDLSSYAVTQIGVLMLSRAGSIQNDGAMHVIRKSDGTFRICAATWGNPGGGAIDIWYGTSSAALLGGGSFVLASFTKLTLPGQAAGYAAYDPFLILDGSTWRLAFTLSESLAFTGNPFYSAAATSPDLATWTLDNIDSRNRPYEGTKFCMVGGVPYITSGSIGTVRCYDKHLNFRGFLNVTTDGGGNTYPHAMVFETGSKTVLLTSDGTKPAGVTAANTWGQMIIHEAV
jgi:hypothetical protein